MFGTILGLHLCKKYPLETTERMAIYILNEIKKYWKHAISSPTKLSISQTELLVAMMPDYFAIFPKLAEIALDNVGGDKV